MDLLTESSPVVGRWLSKGIRSPSFSTIITAAAVITMAARRSITVQVPGLPGQGYVWRRKTIHVNQSEFKRIQSWKTKGYASKSAMILSVFPHRVYGK